MKGAIFKMKKKQVSEELVVKGEDPINLIILLFLL